ncbi:hypothetical protein [Streptomyces orinoci]|uniref:Transposase n=1 Tax=Streptomyces orinoci TaxID=67339 RepID=A0ABV3K0Q3_STRON|nr:hypothetical protein [Streptomyces orinoci]
MEELVGRLRLSGMEVTVAAVLLTATTGQNKKWCTPAVHHRAA